MLTNRAIVTITGEMQSFSRKPGESAKYLGVVELANSGFSTVEIVLPFGTRDFPHVPFMVTVNCDSTICEYRKGKKPLLTVTDWQPMEHYYM